MNYKDFTQLVEFIEDQYNEPNNGEVKRLFRELEKLIGNEGNTDDKNSHT